MDRKLASVQKILNIEPIEGADKIEKLTILGWHVVASKEENYKIGDLVVYIETDSIVPPIKMFEFLKDRKYIVKTIKLRKQISQGLAIPLKEIEKNFKINISKLQEGDDLTKLLGIKKHDPQAEAEAKLLEQDMKKNQNKLHKKLMKFSIYRNLYKEIKTPINSSFPKWIAKTDETRLQVLPELFEAEKNKNTLFSVTEKLDGQSGTYFIQKHKILGFFTKYEFGVCSRNRRLKTENNSSYWTVAKQYDIENTLKSIMKRYNANKVVLQGEICGERIQGNKYKISGNGFYFAVFNLIINGKRYETCEIKEILKPYKIDIVPIIDTDILLKDTIDEMVEYSKGKSTIKTDILREGLVWRSGDGKNQISFKVINPEFLLKNKE